MYASDLGIATPLAFKALGFRSGQSPPIVIASEYGVDRALALLQ